MSLLLLSCSGSKDSDKVAGGFSDETETTEITGLLVDGNGKAQANARLVLRQDYRTAKEGTSIDALESHETFTDASGRYTFTEISSGTWYLEARKNEIGALTKVESGKTDLDLKTDTLRNVGSVVYKSTDPATVAIFLPQLNQVLPLTNGEALITIPGDQVEVIPLTDTEETPEITAIPEILEVSEAASQWTSLFSFNFPSSPDPWLDETGNVTHLQNLNAAAYAVSESVIRFNGNACFSILNDRDYSHPFFQISTRVSFVVASAGDRQSIACLPIVSGEDAWCLERQGADSVVFWYQDGTSPKDSLVVTNVPDSTWIEIVAEVGEEGVSLGVQGVDTVSSTVTKDLSTFTSAITIGCTDENFTGIHFLSADMDWVTLAKQ